MYCAHQYEKGNSPRHSPRLALVRLRFVEVLVQQWLWVGTSLLIKIVVVPEESQEYRRALLTKEVGPPPGD